MFYKKARVSASLHMPEVETHRPGVPKARGIVGQARSEILHAGLERLRSVASYSTS